MPHGRLADPPPRTDQAPGHRDGCAPVRNRLGWSLGTTCPFSCLHCYTRAARRAGRHLSADQVDDIVSRLITSGVRSVVLGGNEPIYAGGDRVRDSLLPRIVERLTEAGIDVAIVSSGLTVTLLERRWPQTLARLAAVAISLDAPTRERHDRNRGARLFDLARRALTLSADHGVAPVVLVTAMRGNFSPDDLERFLDIALAHDAYLRVNTYKSRLGAADPLALPPEDYAPGFGFLVAATTSVVVDEPPLRPWFDLPPMPPPCGRSGGRINLPQDDGRVTATPCQYRADLSRTLGPHGLEVGDGFSRSVCTDHGAYPAGPRPRRLRPYAADPTMDVFRDYLCTWVGRP